MTQDKIVELKQFHFERVIFSFTFKNPVIKIKTDQSVEKFIVILFYNGCDVMLRQNNDLKTLVFWLQGITIKNGLAI